MPLPRPSSPPAAAAPLLALALAAALGPAPQALGAERFTIHQCSFVVRGMGKEPVPIFYAVDAAGRFFSFDTGPGGEGEVRRVPVRVEPAGDGRLLLTHQISLRDGAQRGNVNGVLRVRMPQAGGAARATFGARGYSGDMRGQGTCRVLGKRELPF